MRRDYMELQTQNNHQFHAANATNTSDEKSPAIDKHAAKVFENLAAATAADQNAPANLTVTIERLTAHIEQLTKQLANAVQK